MAKQEYDSPAIIGRIRHLMMLHGMRQNTFASRIGLDAGNFSKVLSGTHPITRGLVNRIIVDLGVSKDWLVDGSGLPFDRPLHAETLTPDALPTIIEPSRNTASAGIPVYDIDVLAGRGELSRMFTSDRIIGHVDLPSLPRDTSLVRVNGDSMTPVIKDGGYVAIRPVNSAGYIFWGQIYVIVLDDYRLVKYLRRHPQTDEAVILHSANPDYDDMEVARVDLRSIFIVDAILNFEIRS